MSVSEFVSVSVSVSGSASVSTLPTSAESLVVPLSSFPHPKNGTLKSNISARFEVKIVLKNRIIAQNPKVYLRFHRTKSSTETLILLKSILRIKDMLKTLPLVETAHRYKNREINEGIFFRAVMSHPTWFVAARREANGISFGAMKTAQGRFLDLFSSRDRIAAFETREGKLPASLESFPGYLLFGMFQDDDFTRINLDTHHPHAFHFFAHQIPVLRSWAQISAVELALSSPALFPDPFAILRRFREYYVVFRSEKPSLLHEELQIRPDFHSAQRFGDLVLDDPRPLAAIFTAPDHVDPFLQHANSTKKGHFWSIKVSGAELFPFLSRKQLDGIVFNPPNQPVALHKNILEKLLN